MALGLWASAHAQPAGEPAGEPGEPTRTIREQIDELRNNPERRVSAATIVLRNGQRHYPELVIVPDEASFIEAIAGWNGAVRYPVLIDDGTPEAREHIARFARAFSPRRIVRYEPSVESLPASAAARRRLIERAWVRSLGPFTDEQVGPEQDVAWGVRSIASSGLPLIGAVVMHPDDPAFVGGLALAAGRFQVPLVVDGWSRREGGGSYPAEQAIAMMRSITSALDGLGLAYGALGDDVDVLTLAFGGPSRVSISEAGSGALTDIIVRTGVTSAGSFGQDLLGDQRKRWAWAGRLSGPASRSAYQAMCSLFLFPTKAWIFDGYGRADELKPFAGTTTAQVLTEMNIPHELRSLPAGDLAAWRAAALSGIDADVLLVNSHGLASSFHLGSIRDNSLRTRAGSGDVPFLLRPSFVSFVHSNGARLGAEEEGIAGRWLRNGAYALVASVEEPTLSGFVGNPALAAKMAQIATLGVGARYAQSRVPASLPVTPWRIEVFGDPMATFAGLADPLEDPLPLDVTPLEDLFRAAAERRDLGEVGPLLLMLGREPDLIRLAKASLARARQGKGRPDGALLEAAMGPLLRAGEHEALVEAFFLLAPERQRDLMMIDMLWFAARARLDAGENPGLEERLGDLVRPGQELIDVVEVAGWLARRNGREVATAYLRARADAMPNDNDRRSLENQIERFGG